MTFLPRDLATYLAARLVPALATMCMTFLCIHSLRPEEYATYSLTLLVVGVAAGFVGGVSGQAMLRYSHELSACALRRGLLAFPLIAAVLVCPFVIGYLAWSVGLSDAALFATATIPALALMDTRRSLFVARGRADAVFALDGWRAGAALLLAFVLLRTWGARAAAPMLAQLVSIIVCLLLVPSQRVGTQQAGGRAVDARYVVYGLGIAGWMAVIVGLSLAERTVMTAVAGLAESGRYSAQADVVNAVFSAAGGALASAMMPAYLAQSHAPNAMALRRLCGLGLLGVLAVAALCVGVGTVLSVLGLGRISQVLTGDSRTALALVAAGAVWTAGGFVQKPLELRGQTPRMFAGVTLALLLFLAIAPTLAVRLGGFGVALAKLIAGLAYGAIAISMVRKPR